MAKARSKVEELNRSAERARDAQQRHIAALQADVARWKALAAVSLRELRGKWGPSFDDLILAIEAANEACDPLRGSPQSDTGRVSVQRKGSRIDEGAATRRMREKRAGYQQDLQDLANNMAQTFGAELPDRRDYSAHVRWHESRGRPSRDCRYCQEAA
jgi:hypothetical protein